MEYLVWFKSSETMTMLWPSNVSRLIQAWALKKVAWPWFQCADWTSHWLAMVAFSEKSTCKTTLLPSHFWTSDLKEAACFLLTHACNKKGPTCRSNHPPFQLCRLSRPDCRHLPLLVVNWVGLVGWSIFFDGICTLRELATHALFWASITSDLLDECWNITIQAGMFFQCHKQKPHTFVAATHTRLMRYLI